MHGSAQTMGLHVYLLQGRFADGVWWKRNEQGDAWRLAQVDLNTTGPFQVWRSRVTSLWLAERGRGWWFLGKTL